MPIGTSDGQYFEDEWAYATSKGMPLKATEKPAGEFNSQEGTQGYEDWIKQNNLTPSDDYNLEAAYKDGFQPDSRGHLPDTYKLPNHITFSEESKYNNTLPYNEFGLQAPKGEKYQGGQWMKDGETWTFTPGPTNLKYHTTQELIDYFKQHEPDARLILPGS